MPTPSDLSPRLLDALRSQRALVDLAGGVEETLVGGSMQPSVRVGQSVRVGRSGYLWPGDAALFLARSGEPVLHRVVLQVPWVGRVIHAGDAGGGLAVAHRRSVIGRAQLPRRLPTWTRCGQAVALLARALARRARATLARGESR
jgi:hypothetical protein